MRCDFLTEEVKCSLREDGATCKQRKVLGECPIDKGIPGGSARIFWSVWLKNGGSKDIPVEDFMKLKLSDIYGEEA